MSDREILKVINSFALRLISIPTRQELVWYVAREVVGRLGFDDCVIYLYDPASNVLRQSAAIGEDKNPSSNEIRNPLEIPIGQGITGHVAQTRTSLIIDDLLNDDRYIPDVNAARSEICVPLLSDGRFYGVIDSEAPQPNQFTPEHLEILMTVSAMASAKLRLLEQDKTLEMNEMLREALTAAETANQAKSDFLATISHELRTPLTSIKGAIGLLVGTRAGEFSEDSRSLLNMVQHNSDTLIRLVNEFLDYEKIIAGKMAFNFAPHDIAQLTRDIVETSFGLAQTHSVHFTYHAPKTPALANIDRARFDQILQNLLSNAAKFSPQDGNVDVFVEVTPNRIRTAVKDSGIGIADSHKQMIFDRFTQIDSSDARQQGGTGLGLAISKALAENMNGALGFESTIGNGATFYLDLPKIEPQET